jgi:hypothetical protein
MRHSVWIALSGAVLWALLCPTAQAGIYVGNPTLSELPAGAPVVAVHVQTEGLVFETCDGGQLYTGALGLQVLQPALIDEACALELLVIEPTVVLIERADGEVLSGTWAATEVRGETFSPVIVVD